MNQSALRVERVDWDDADTELRRKLLTLNLASRRPCPFFTSEFIDAYLDHNERFERAHVDPFLLTVRRPSGELIGALPLKRTRMNDRIPYRQIEFLVTTEIDLPTTLAAPEHADAVATALLGHMPRLLTSASDIHLLNLSERSTLRGAQSEASTWFTKVQEAPGMPISFIAVTHDSAADYFADLSKRMRSNISRLSRRLAAVGEIEVLTTKGKGALSDLFDLYLQLEDRSWKRGTEASLRRHPERVQMYSSLHSSASAIEHDIDILTIDGVPAAGLMSMHFGSVCFLMETCYDEIHADLSPSNILIFRAIDRAIRGGASEISLHGHFDYYKHRWLAESAETVEIRIVRRGSVPDIRWQVGELVRRFRGDDDRQADQPTGNRENPAPVPEGWTADSPARTRANPDVCVIGSGTLGETLPFDMFG